MLPHAHSKKYMKNAFVVVDKGNCIHRDITHPPWKFRKKTKNFHNIKTGKYFTILFRMQAKNFYGVEYGKGRRGVGKNIVIGYAIKTYRKL